MSAPPPEYGAPQPGQQPPPYGQGYAPPPTSAYPTSSGRGQAFGVAGAVVVAIGAVLLILGFTVFDWFRSNYESFGGGASKSKFSDVHHQLDLVRHQIDQSPSVSKYVHFGVAPTYFGWLGWVLLVAAIVLAVVALVPLGAASPAVRIVAVLVALAGIGLTLWALDLISIDSKLAGQLTSSGQKNPDYWYYVKHTSFGAWATLLGFLLVGIGALMGPRRVNRF